MSTKLVVYLHVCQIIQDVCTLPGIFQRNDSLCAFIGFWHMYSGIANVLVVFAMVLQYRHLFFEDRLGMTQYVCHWARAFSFVLPLVALLPFITSSYGASGEDGFCALKRTNHNSPEIAYFYSTLIIAVAIGFTGVAILLATTLQVFMLDVELGIKVVKSIGLYAAITLVFWIPRILIETSLIHRQSSGITGTEYFVLCILVFFCGAGYVLVFLQERNSMKLFEESFLENRPLSIDDEDHEDFNDLIYSWETEEFQSSQRNQSCDNDPKRKLLF